MAAYVRADSLMKAVFDTIKYTLIAVVIFTFIKLVF